MEIEINKNTINKENEAKNEIVKGDKELGLSRKVSFIRESVSDSGVPERRLSGTGDWRGDVAKRNSLRSQEPEPYPNNLSQDGDSPKVARKIITTWRHACDRTKDRTRELLKRWRTLPEGNTEMLLPNNSCNPSPQGNNTIPDNPHNWSVHVWASYIKRYPSEDENLMEGSEVKVPTSNLTSTQKEKFGHFFSHLFDSNHDELISEQDFENFSERLRRFADWSVNSPEFVIMAQVQQGFLNTFLSNKGENCDRWKQFVGLEEWFQGWSILCNGASSLQDFPIWLQYLPKLLFQAINKSGSGLISRDELSSFYSSMLGFSTQRVGEILDEAFNTLTSNGDHPINYSVYRLAFINFLLGRHPNGPGQCLFGCVTKKAGCFPIDYSALNSSPEDREHYTPDKKSNRVSVVV